MTKLYYSVLKIIKYKTGKIVRENFRFNTISIKINNYIDNSIDSLLYCALQAVLFMLFSFLYLTD